MTFLQISCCLFLLFCTGCHPQTKAVSRDTKLLNATQKTVVAGMTQPVVAKLLGMPNIATRDARGKQAWIYERFASEVSFSDRDGGSWLISTRFTNSETGARETQKTLTVVVKFGDDDTVDDVTYHSTQF
jgi:hypothetical protein